MKTEIEIAVVGAGGLIGEALLQMIAEHSWLNGHLQLLGGKATEGQEIEFGRQELVVSDAALYEFSRQQIVIVTGDETVDSDWLQPAQDAGCIILDLSSKLLAEYALPPLVAAVNPEVIAQVADGGILALPDAATTQLVTLLKSIQGCVEINRASVVSCHAVSELGRSGVEEMARQTARLLNGKALNSLVFTKQIAFNLLPLVGNQQSHGLSEVEVKIADDAKKVLRHRDMKLSVSCCWVPVFFGHSQAIDLQFDAPISVAQLKKALSNFPDISLFDTSDSYPTAVTDASGNNGLTVGRVKSDSEYSTDFSLWTVADNLRFGNAGNAVKVVEILVKNYL